jgi:hypothetical protein
MLENVDNRQAHDPHQWSDGKSPEQSTRAPGSGAHQASAANCLDRAGLHECPPEEREQMRQELASALNRLQTVVRKSNVDELMQAEQIARIEALRQEIAG